MARPRAINRELRFDLRMRVGGRAIQTNYVPASVRLMIERAVEFRAGSGLADIAIGSLKIDVPDSYQTDAIPREITNIARAFFYRPGLIYARP